MEKKILDYNTKQFINYKENVKSKTHAIHMININVSELLFENSFNPALYISYIYDYTNSYNFATANFKAFKKEGFKVKITRKFSALDTFSEDDFKFEIISTSLNNYKYIKQIANENIIKLLNEHYYLKNIVKWIVVDEKDENSIKEIYSNKNLIPQEKLNVAIETIAKPKIILRIFKNLKENSLLTVFERHHYLKDNIVYVPDKGKFEFIKKVSNVLIEVTKN